MQITINTQILETIFAHATTAARLTSYIDDPLIVDGLTVGEELATSMNEIGRIVAELLGKPYDAPPAGGPTQDDEPELDDANSVDILRQQVARADAFANAAETFFDEMPAVKDKGDGQRFERIARLVSVTAAAVRAALVVGDRLASSL